MVAVLHCGAVSSRHVLGGRSLGHPDRHGVHTVAGVAKELCDRTAVSIATRLRCDKLQSASPVQHHAQAHVFEDEIRERETEFGEEVGGGVYPVRVDGVHDVVDARGSGPVVRGCHITTLHRERYLRPPLSPPPELAPPPASLGSCPPPGLPNPPPPPGLGSGSCLGGSPPPGFPGAGGRSGPGSCTGGCARGGGTGVEPVPRCGRGWLLLTVFLILGGTRLYAYWCGCRLSGDVSGGGAEGLSGGGVAVSAVGVGGAVVRAGGFGYVSGAASRGRRRCQAGRGIVLPGVGVHRSGMVAGQSGADVAGYRQWHGVSGVSGSRLWVAGIAAGFGSAAR